MNLVIKKSDCKPFTEHDGIDAVVNAPSIHAVSNNNEVTNSAPDGNTSSTSGGSGFICDETQCYLVS